MNTRTILTVAATLAMGGNLAAATPSTRDYPVQDFRSVVVSSDLDVDILVGPERRLVAEARRGNFEGLSVSVEDGVLRIERPRRSWLSAARREDYHVRVTTPALASVAASSDSEVHVAGSIGGDFSVEASSGAEVDVRGLDAGKVTARASSRGEIELAGRCVSIDARASSGGDVDAEDLHCGSATVEASSAGEIAVRVTGPVTGSASSGGEVEVHGAEATIDVAESSGGRARKKF